MGGYGLPGGLLGEEGAGKGRKLVARELLGDIRSDQPTLDLRSARGVDKYNQKQNLLLSS